MVENTLKQKKEGNSIISGKTLLIIAGGVFAALIFSLYWQINNARNFFNSGTTIPDIEALQKDPRAIIQGQQPSQADPYKQFSTPDGYLSLKYPSSFTDGQKIVEQTANTIMDPNNSLLFAYKIDFSITSMIPTSLSVARYDASSTEEVVGMVKQSFLQQQCQSDIEATDEGATNDEYKLFDSTYKCGDQGDLSLWRARTAMIQKNEREFYAITVATISKNWDNAKLELNSIIDSISITKPAAPAEEAAAGDKDIQNNETVEQ